MNLKKTILLEHVQKKITYAYYFRSYGTKKIFISISSCKPIACEVNEITCTLRIPYLDVWGGGGCLHSPHDIYIIIIRIFIHTRSTQILITTVYTQLDNTDAKIIK